MKEFLDGWVRDIAFYTILMTVLLHLLPGESQRKYVRFFLGIVLMLVVLSPVLKLAGVAEELDKAYAAQTYDEELQAFIRRQEELEQRLQEGEETYGIPDIKVEIGVEEAWEGAEEGAAGGASSLWNPAGGDSASRIHDRGKEGND